MRIGTISDTHDRLDNIERALAFFAEREVDIVIHCGDWKSLSAFRYFVEKADQYGLPVRGVLGNNDEDPATFISLASNAPGDVQLREGVLELDLGGVTTAVYHGHHAPTLRRTQGNESYRLVLLGHTHKPRIESPANRLIVNPGSTAFGIPRSRDWQPTVAIVETEPLSGSLHSLDELG